MTDSQRSTDTPVNPDFIRRKPPHWGLAPLFAVARPRNTKNVGMREDNLLSLSYGRIVRRDITTNEGLLPESFETYQIVEPGDTVFRLTDLQNDQRSLRTALVAERGIITSAYLALEPTGVLPEYFAYLVRAYDHDKTFYRMGSGLRQSLKFEELRRLPVLVPPYGEQRRIVAFLDHETARIDELVREQERLIELLVEDLDAQIFSLFTAGASRSVHRSASGNPWFPEIPSHWTMSRLGWVVASIQTGPFGSQLHAEDYVTSGTPLINPASIGPRGLIEEDARRVDEETLNRLKDYRLRSGDIVLGRRGQMGRCALVTDGQDGWLLGTGSMRIRPNSSVNEEFLAFYLGSRIARSYLELESVGTTMSNLNSEIVGGLPLPLPPISEQDAIVTSIQEATRLVDESIDAAKSMIEYLLERRSALISSAVTGQLDLRDWRPPAAAPVAVAEVA